MYRNPRAMYLVLGERAQPRRHLTVITVFIAYFLFIFTPLCILKNDQNEEKKIAVFFYNVFSTNEFAYPNIIHGEQDGRNLPQASRCRRNLCGRETRRLCACPRGTYETTYPHIPMSFLCTAPSIYLLRRSSRTFNWHPPQGHHRKAHSTLHWLDWVSLFPDALLLVERLHSWLLGHASTSAEFLSKTTWGVMIRIRLLRCVAR